MKRLIAVMVAGLVAGAVSSLPADEPLALGLAFPAPEAKGSPDFHRFEAYEPIDLEKPEEPEELRFNVASSTSLSMAPDFAATALGQDGGGGKSFFGLKLGAFWGTDDIDDLDEVFYAELIFGRYLIGELLAIEADVGFFYDDDEVGSADVTFWGVPLFLNARADINILFLTLYGGLGIGGIYANVEVDTPLGDDDEDDFVVAGDVFLGVLAKIGPIYAGVEGKYIITDEADFGGGAEFNLDGVAVTATVGLRF